MSSDFVPASSAPLARQHADTPSLRVLRHFDPARESLVGGWLRLAFFCSILFNHTIKVHYEFLDERVWVIWLQTFRDFGAVGFFIIGGVTLKRKIIAADGAQVVLPANLVRLTLAGVALAGFTTVLDFLKGASSIESLHESFYFALYETNLWFFIAYAFASPMLVSLSRRGVLWTSACCLLFIMFPARMPLISPFILQTTSLGFVCMAIGMGLHARTVPPAIAVAIALATYVLRISLDDFGAANNPEADVVLRILYGVAWFLLLKSIANRLSDHVRPPGWANYLFVPYIIQMPLVLVVTAVSTALFTRSLDVKMPPIFFSFWDLLGFMLFVFLFSAAASFVLAWFLRRYRIRV